MSTLTLVRHAQAHPFLRADGALTALGEAQAASLARHWIDRGAGFDEVHTGVLAWQVRTAEIVARGFREAGRPWWPAASCDPAWNEYDATGVLDRLAPSVPKLAALVAAFEQARGGPEERCAFQQMFQSAMGCWIEAAHDVAGVEPWPAFRSRVMAALARITAGPPGRRVAVFTSGGPIGLAVQHAFEAPARGFLDTNWRIRNTSVTEFVFDRERLTLDSFNCIAHFADGEMRTFR